MKMPPVNMMMLMKMEKTSALTIKVPQGYSPNKHQPPIRAGTPEGNAGPRLPG
jgi:hypothetical protein